MQALSAAAENPDSPVHGKPEAPLGVQEPVLEPRLLQPQAWQSIEIREARCVKAPEHTLGAASLRGHAIALAQLSGEGEGEDKTGESAKVHGICPNLCCVDMYVVSLLSAGPRLSRKPPGSKSKQDSACHPPTVILSASCWDPDWPTTRDARIGSCPKSVHEEPPKPPVRSLRQQDAPPPGQASITRTAFLSVCTGEPPACA